MRGIPRWSPTSRSEFEPALYAIAFAPSGRLYGATNGPRSAIVEINRATGETVIVGPTTNLDIRGLAIVPDPSAIWIILISAAALGRACCLTARG